MNTFLTALGAGLMVLTIQGVAVVGMQAQAAAMEPSNRISTDLYQDEYIPPDNGAPDRTQGSGTR
jgi:hypothetical protein